jgi:hypothetical protein
VGAAPCALLLRTCSLHGLCAQTAASLVGCV